MDELQFKLLKRGCTGSIWNAAAHTLPKVSMVSIYGSYGLCFYGFDSMVSMVSTFLWFLWFSWFAWLLFSVAFILFPLFIRQFGANPTSDQLEITVENEDEETILQDNAGLCPRALVDIQMFIACGKISISEDQAMAEAWLSDAGLMQELKTAVVLEASARVRPFCYEHLSESSEHGYEKDKWSTAESSEHGQKDKWSAENSEYGYDKGQKKVEHGYDKGQKGIIRGSIIRLIEGDIESLDCSSDECRLVLDVLYKYGLGYLKEHQFYW